MTPTQNVGVPPRLCLKCRRDRRGRSSGLPSGASWGGGPPAPLRRHWVPLAPQGRLLVELGLDLGLLGPRFWPLWPSTWAHCRALWLAFAPQEGAWATPGGPASHRHNDPSTHGSNFPLHAFGPGLGSALVNLATRVATVARTFFFPQLPYQARQSERLISCQALALLRPAIRRANGPVGV